MYLKLINLLSLVVLFCLFSCVTQKNVEYLQDNTKTSKEFVEAEIQKYKLKPNDELFIQISSLDDPASSIFSSSGIQPYYVGTIQPYGASLVAYSVDKNGDVNLPVIGKISVLDKTTEEVSDMLKTSLLNILSQPVVSVKLVNRYVTVLGEVTAPGHYPYAQTRLSIFDAIGLAGDITEYGNRKSVIVTHNADGKNTRLIVDLTRSDLLSSSDYFIYPNDIIYVKPLNRKFWGMRQFPYSILLSTITTALLVYSVTK